MTSFSTLPLGQFIESIASAQPTPGGGTAAAVTGAVGTALLVMVSSLPKTRTGSDVDKAALAEARGRLVPIMNELQTSADRDAASFDAVLAAFRLPKGTDEEKATRRVKVQEAYREATEAPLATLRLAVGALDEAEAVARHGVASAASDVGVGSGLLLAAAEGAAANVRINLTSLSDEAFRDRAETETRELLARAEQSSTRAQAAIAAQS
jgi:formiminotetrahydrofolate cyclodeaminase